MTRNRPDSSSIGLPESASLAVVGAIACLWGLTSMVPQIPRQGYFLLPLTAVAAGAFCLFRLGFRSSRFQFSRKSGLTAALFSWFVAATMSTMLNWKTDEVVITYCAVFGSGFLLYIALSGITLSDRQLDIAVVGLAVGCLFPLAGGLLAFGIEWGTPDLSTLSAAYLYVERMRGYEAATFGNRGNTAAFLVIVVPLLMAAAMDRRKRAWVRGVCCLALSLAAMNLLILQVRAVFITLSLFVVVIWVFKLGARWLPVLIATAAVGSVVLFTVAPDAAEMMRDHLTAAATLDSEGDASIRERVAAIQEGLQIAQRNWLLGVGPGAALTVHSHDSAHQFQVQQGMETGIFGFLGSLMFAVSVWVSFVRSLLNRSQDERNNVRFLLLLGPAAYAFYAVLANATLGFGSLNVWTVLITSMLALTPAFERGGAMRWVASTAPSPATVHP